MLQSRAFSSFAASSVQVAMPDWITIKGARQNNLKNLDLAIPKNKLVVITGPSGAGKSSLVFDTLYAEGQRRYVESLSSSARQFLTQLEKPDVDAIDGLSPAIAIEQRRGPANPRSTVGTASEIYDYLRLLFARVGKPTCYRCDRSIRSHTVQEIVDEALARHGEPRALICAPVTRDPAVPFPEFLAQMQREGFVRLRVDGTVHLIEEGVPPPEREGASLALVVDRLALARGDRQRLTEAVELALRYGAGRALLVFLAPEGEEEAAYSKFPLCPDCGITYPEPHPRNFSFNTPEGACATCHGLGHTLTLSLERLVPDPDKTLAEGAIAPWQKSEGFRHLLEQVAAHFGFSIFTPFGRLSDEHRGIILHGTGDADLALTLEGEGSHYRYSQGFEGVIPNLERRFRETESSTVREDIRRYMTESTCPDCEGGRLRKESLHYFLGGRSITGVARLPLPQAREWMGGLALSAMEREVAAKLVSEISARLGFLEKVGLHYLSLDRTMDSLSSGENQRVRLATQIGSALSGVIYILDEPTIGLHQRDTQQLLGTLAELREAGNTVLVVEHDRETMLHADYLFEIGPRAGEEGGRLVAEGTPAEIRRNPDSATGQYLEGTRGIRLPNARRPVGGPRLEVRGAAGHNLKNIDLDVPLGLFVCVTGVSGSGKSTLVLETIFPALQHHLMGKPRGGLPLAELGGAHFIERVIRVDQTPIGRSARANPGTYVGVFSLVRDQFAAVPESRTRGYSARRFSFNVEGGRCDACLGEGLKRIEMHFLPDVFVRCDVCEGSRYNRETLEIRYRGKRIDEILRFTVSEAEQFFRAIPAIRSRLRPMIDVGLGYIQVGQPANTLSGGEAQRLKIARELGRQDARRTLYLLDEPTTGLHFSDVERLLEVINQLVEGGNSVIVIEHNLELIKCADYVIELGPEGGEAGGRVIAQGTPEELLAFQEISPTAAFLREYLPESGKRAGFSGRKDTCITAQDKLEP